MRSGLWKIFQFLRPRSTSILEEPPDRSSTQRFLGEGRCVSLLSTSVDRRGRIELSLHNEAFQVLYVPLYIHSKLGQILPY